MLLSTFSSVFSLNSNISSSVSSWVTLIHSLMSSSTAHSVTKCPTVSSTAPHSGQSSALPAKPCLHFSLRVFVLHWNRMTDPDYCSIFPHPPCSSYSYTVAVWSYFILLSSIYLPPIHSLHKHLLHWMHKQGTFLIRSELKCKLHENAACVFLVFKSL